MYVVITYMYLYYCWLKLVVGTIAKSPFNWFLFRVQQFLEQLITSPSNLREVGYMLTKYSLPPPSATLLISLYYALYPSSPAGQGAVQEPQSISADMLAYYWILGLDS